MHLNIKKIIFTCNEFLSAPSEGIIESPQWLKTKIEFCSSWFVLHYSYMYKVLLYVQYMNSVFIYRICTLFIKTTWFEIGYGYRKLEDFIYAEIVQGTLQWTDRWTWWPLRWLPCSCIQAANGPVLFKQFTCISVHFRPSLATWESHFSFRREGQTQLVNWK